ncbi:MAG: DUF192 domain-containing protein [Polyangiales bacterium]
MSRRFPWICSLLALLLGCPSSADPEPARAVAAQTASPAAAKPAAEPHVVLLPPGHDPVSVRVEVASTEPERRKGLMFRTHLDDDAGMIFLFERPEALTFWMHNTYIPLDMIFVEPSMHVLGVVENAEPQTDASRSVSGESQYVLEVNAGFSRRNGVTKGTLVRFEGVARSQNEGP